MKNTDCSSGLLPTTTSLVLVLLTCASLGCVGNTIEAPPVDPQGAAAKALELYDTDGDGKLSAKELIACPGLLSALKRYDTDGDSQISQAELVAKLERVLSSGVGMVGVRCHLILNGRPLPGAQVRYVPEAFLAEALYPAEGTTDNQGVARLIVPDELLPEKQRGLGLMQYGVFRVEITAPDSKLSPKYGDENSPLGHDVDPTVRVGGTATEFLLSSK